jgi:hypothetical protein
VKDKQRIFHLVFARYPSGFQPPKARNEKVARLREAVSQGDYRVDARKVAYALLKEHLIDQMIMQAGSYKNNTIASE